MFYSAPFHSEIPQYVGLGVSKLIGDKLAELGCKKVYFIMDKGVEASGVPQKTIELIKAKGIEVITDSDALTDPPDTSIEAMAVKAKKAGVDGFVAMGGGSTIDTAKGVSALQTNEGPLMKYLDMTLPQNPGLPLILIPTTSGTGSEANPFIITTDTKTGLKVGMGGPGFAPVMALCDPELLTGIPKAVTASCAFDALAHIIDGMTNVLTSGITQALGLQGIALFRRSLDTVYNDGKNVKGRYDMLMVANIGGIIINNAFCNISHGLGHTLGALNHTAHGTAVAIFTPACLEYMADACPDEVKMIADAFDIKYDDKTSIAEIARMTAQTIYELMKSVNLPDLKDLIPNKEDAYKIIPIAPTDQNSALCAKPLDEDGTKWIIDRTYEYVLGGK